MKTIRWMFSSIYSVFELQVRPQSHKSITRTTILCSQFYAMNVQCNFLLSVPLGFTFGDIFFHHMHTPHHKMRSTKCNLIIISSRFVISKMIFFLSAMIWTFFFVSNDIYTHEFRTREHYLSNMLGDSCFFFFFSRGFTCFFSLSSFFSVLRCRKTSFLSTFVLLLLYQIANYTMLFLLDSKLFFVKWINDLC